MCILSEWVTVKFDDINTAAVLTELQESISCVVKINFLQVLKPQCNEVNVSAVQPVTRYPVYELT